VRVGRGEKIPLGGVGREIYSHIFLSIFIFSTKIFSEYENIFYRKYFL
jgi:hypothetical protein